MYLYNIQIIANGKVLAEDELRVSLGSNKEADFNLDELTAERIEVTGARVSAIDLTSMDSGLVMGETEIDRMPIARDLTSVALLAPGAVAGDSAFGNTASFGGASVAENSCYINGLEVTNTRQGTGAIFRDTTNDFDNSFDYTVSASGPIIEDKLFFYALINPRDVHNQFGGTNGTERFAGANIMNVDESSGSDNLFWGAKIDWDITENHRLSFFGYSDKNETTRTVYDYDAETGTIGDYSGSFLRKRGGEAKSVTYTGYLNDDLSVSAMWGNIQTDYSSDPSNLDCSSVTDARDGISDAERVSSCGPGGSFGANEDENTQYRFDIEYYWGDHKINAGLDKQTRESIRITQPIAGHSWTYETLAAGGNIQGDSGSLYVNNTGAAQDLVSDRIFSGGGSYGDTFYIYQGCAVEGDTCAQEDKLYRYAPRGSAGRTPWTFKVDLSAAYAFSYEGVDMRTSINIFNVLNTQEALALNEHYESSEGTVNQWYGAAYSWQAPRSVRLTFEARY